jgi:hypothetical protein
MQKKYGIEYVDNMISESKKLHKERSKADYQEIINNYSTKIIQLAARLTA